MNAADERIDRVVFGTADLRDDLDSRRLLDEVFEIGCITFDTARIYASGASERCLGHWLRRRSIANQVTVITKGGHPQSWVADCASRIFCRTSMRHCRR